MSRRFVLTLALAAAAVAGTAQTSVASESAGAAAKGRDCRPANAGGILLKFSKLRAFSVRCKRARSIARRVYNNSERCAPDLFSGGTETCTIRGYSCRTSTRRDAPTYTGRCVRGKRKVAYTYHV
jgi:hypothetical protein